MQSDTLGTMLSEPYHLQQYFKPYCKELSLESTPELPAENARFNAVLIQGAKNMTETKYAIAKGALALEQGGTLSICADNKSGGTRLEKLLKEIGFTNADSYSKHKARVAWGSNGALNQATVQKWIEQGSAQEILGGEYKSRPGIFGWDKIDKGSKLLIENLPPAGPQGQTKIFKGKGADFGCGYGYLTKELLTRYKGITAMTCIDADHRAVEACRLNTESVAEGTKIEHKWLDLTTQSGLKNLDFIIMNPPFHEGKTTDQSIGKSFIENAATALKKHGELWIVANNHLGYEPILEENFYSVENIFEGQGFKVFRAVK